MSPENIASTCEKMPSEEGEEGGFGLTPELASYVRPDLMKKEIDGLVGVVDYTGESIYPGLDRLFGLSEQDFTPSENSMLVVPAMLSAVYKGSMSVDEAVVYMPELFQYKELVGNFDSIQSQEHRFSVLRSGYPDLGRVAGLWTSQELVKVIRPVLGFGGSDHLLPKVMTVSGKKTAYPKALFSLLVSLEKKRLDEVVRVGNRHYLGPKNWYQELVEKNDFCMLRGIALEPLNYLRKLLLSYQERVRSALDYCPEWGISEWESRRMDNLLQECFVLVGLLDNRYVESIKTNEEADKQLFLDPPPKARVFSRFRGFLIDRSEEEVLMRLNDEFLNLYDCRRPDSSLGIVFDQVVELAFLARRHIVLANIGIVYSALKGIVGLNSGMAEDLIEDGLVSIMENALDKYDIHKGYRFATYARWWALKAIEKSLSQKYFAAVRVPYGRVVEERMVEVYRQKIASGILSGGDGIDQEIKEME